MLQSIDAERRLYELERQLDAIKSISSSLANQTDAGDIIKDALEVAVSTLDAQAGSILLSDPDRKLLTFKYAIGPQSSELIGKAIASKEGVAGWVFQTGEPRITEEALTDEYFLPDVDLGFGWQTHTILTVPLRTLGGATLGVIQVLNKKKGFFDDSDLELLCVVAAQAATLLHTAKLHEEARLASIVRAVGDISHDIKNMLTPVITCAQTLDSVFDGAFSGMDSVCKAAEGTESDRVAHDIRESVAFLRTFHAEAIAMILEGAQDVQDQVRQLADCVKGHITAPHFEALPLEPIVAKVFRALEFVASKQGVALRMDGLSAMPHFSMDAKILYSAIYNLVDNALQATPPGGSVTVSAQIDVPSTDETSGWISIRVIDTGKGVPEHVRALLFTDAAISTKADGTGLGTRIIKNAVDAHGGTVGVRCETGKGSTFTLRLPMRH